MQHADGAQVPLSAFAHYEPTNTPLAVNHQGQFAASTISFNLPPGVSLSQATRGDRRRAGAHRRARRRSTARFQGTRAARSRQSLDSQPLLILAALLTVYIVLGMLYESYVHPITILSTLPSAGVGALLALLLFNTEFTHHRADRRDPADRHREEERDHDDRLRARRRAHATARRPRDAIFEACLLRFRPIMMTTMAALLGALPLALGTGDGAELRRPLGIAIVGGLIVSQLLTLYTTPVVYLYLDRFRLWCARTRRAAAARRAARPARARATHDARARTMRHASLCAALAAALAGCTVGPDYVRPTRAAPRPRTRRPATGRSRSPPTTCRAATWWEVFDDPELDALEAQVDVSNQTVQAAEARVPPGAAPVDAGARAALFPTVGVGASARARQQRRSAPAAAARGRERQQQLQRRARRELGDRPVGPRPPQRRGERGDARRRAPPTSRTARLSLQAQLAQDYFLLRVAGRADRAAATTRSPPTSARCS